MVKTVWIRQLKNGGSQFLFQIIWIYNFSKFTEFIVVNTGKAGIHYSKYGPPDNYQTTYDSKTKIFVFYSLTNLSWPEFNPRTINTTDPYPRDHIVVWHITPCMYHWALNLCKAKPLLCNSFQVCDLFMFKVNDMHVMFFLPNDNIPYYQTSINQLNMVLK